MNPHLRPDYRPRTRPAGSASSALKILALSAVLALVGVVSSHATLVIGSFEFTPDPPVAGEPTLISITLKDPLLVGVEKALVRVQFREYTPDGPSVPESATGSEAVEFLASSAVLSSDYFPEPERGTYEETITAPPAGSYTVSVRDTTFRNEEAVANIRLTVGEQPNGRVAFVLPPTPIAPRSLSTWLIWLIGVPLVAGVLITVLVLRQGPNDGSETSEEPAR